MNKVTQKKGKGEMSSDPTEYRVTLAMESGAELTMLMFDHKQHRSMFDYRFLSGEGREFDIINEYKLVVDYQDGVLADDFVLSMNIVFPKRRGQEYLWGVDISKNSKVFIQFKYIRFEYQSFKLT